MTLLTIFSRLCMSYLQQKLLATSSQNSVGATNASAAASNVKPPLSSKSVDSSGGIKRNDPGYVSPRALALASQYNTYNVQKSAAKKKNTVPVWVSHRPNWSWA